MNEYKQSFQEGQKQSKFKSRKEAWWRGSIQGIIIGLSIFNDFPIYIKILTFILLQLVFGIIASSRWYHNQFSNEPYKKAEPNDWGEKLVESLNKAAMDSHSNNQHVR